MSSSTGLEWFKSSYSGSDGGNHLEMAPNPTTMHIRDSKDRGRGHGTITPAASSAFLSLARGRRP